MNRDYVLKMAAFAAGLVLLTGTARAECFVYVDRDQLREVTVDGQTWLAGPREPIERQDCRPDQDLSERAVALRQLQQLVSEYPEATAELVAGIVDYRILVQQYDERAQGALALAQNYDGLTRRYDTLSGDYANLSLRYDNLATDYRELALASQSGISFDAGIGVNDNGDVATLLGVGFRKLRLWGTVDEEQNALFIGRTFRF